MSYDLVFWKQRSNSTTDPSSIYHALMDGLTVEELETLPIAELFHRIHQHFPGIVTTGGLTYWEGGDRGFFELYSSPKHLHICCRQLPASEINKLIEIAAEFGCPLYDPQVNKRFAPL
jgi:hypothetical protein